jgi:hypothetical protein
VPGRGRAAGREQVRVSGAAVACTYLISEEEGQSRMANAAGAGTPPPPPAGADANKARITAGAA